MLFNDAVQTDQNETNAPEPKPHSAENAGGEQVMAKFPEWDILPPHAFINPRIKKTQ